MRQGRDALVVFDDLGSPCARLSRTVAAAAPSAGPRKLSRRHLLHPLAAAGALHASAQGAGRRIAHRAADRRNRRTEHLGLHSDQPDLDHRRPDLSDSGSCFRRAFCRRWMSASRYRAWAAKRNCRPIAPSPATCACSIRNSRNWRCSRASARGWTSAPAQTLARGRAVREALKQPQFDPLPAPEQVAMLVAATAGLFDNLQPDRVVERVGAHPRRCSRRSCREADGVHRSGQHV